MYISIINIYIIIFSCPTGYYTYTRYNNNIITHIQENTQRYIYYITHKHIYTYDLCMIIYI